jgi:Nucleotidyl transferase AbiEii toxin, Type IV TA system
MTEHPFENLVARGKEPTAKRNLDTWISQAVEKTGIAPKRLSWLVASSVVIGALQREISEDGYPRVLLKGGAYIEVRLGLKARATSDVDTLFRGAFSEAIETIDAALREPWGAIEFERTEIEIISGARRVVKPIRFSVKLKVKGQVWRSIDVEVAPDEGGVGDRAESIPVTSLHHFGLPTAADASGIAMDFQVAQKFHACSDPHDPPEFRNMRARDIVDLLLLRNAFYSGDPHPDLRRACEALFLARAEDAAVLGRPQRTWPPLVIPYDDWQTDFRTACQEAEVDWDLFDSAKQVNEWIASI